MKGPDAAAILRREIEAGIASGMDSGSLTALFSAYADTMQNSLESSKQAVASLSAATLTDPGTGIANRRAFDVTLGQELSRARRDGTSVALIMVDVDRFKAYNDAYGHVAGDEALESIAGALARTLRRPGELVARYGGEEFGVILPRSDLAGAVNVARALQESVRSLRIDHSENDGRGYATASFGLVSIVPDALTRPKTLVGLADGALYEAKSLGRDRLAVSEASLAAAALTIVNRPYTGEVIGHIGATALQHLDDGRLVRHDNIEGVEDLVGSRVTIRYSGESNTREIVPARVREPSLSSGAFRL